SDGASVGTITAQGFGGNSASPPPGAPLSATAFNLAITGGTGAYLGVRGQLVRGPVTTGARVASITEDPANRRANGGGKIRWIAHLLPLFTPQIAVAATGPAVVHASDFTPVTTAKPAAAGEILSLFATGLGPVRPGVNPGQIFPLSPLAAVTSPVEVRVGGQRAQVLAAVGFPGSVDGYQVIFRMPANVPKGVAAIQLSVAWIPGAAVTIPVQ